MELNTSISKTAKQIADKTTDFVFEELNHIIDWQLSGEDYDYFLNDDYELVKSLAIKEIIENIYKRL
jgi:hypothetical protein